MLRGRHHPILQLVYGVLPPVQEPWQLIRTGFRVSEAPTNNKGWETRYLFVSRPKWGFQLEWSAHLISNIPPYLSEESVLVGRLKGILSSYQVIRDIIELMLVEAGLSLAPRRMHFISFTDMVTLGKLRGMPKVSVSQPVARAPYALSEVQEVPTGASMRAMVTPAPKRLTAGFTSHSEDPAHPEKRVKMTSGRHKSRRDEGGSLSHSKGKEPTTSGGESTSRCKPDGGALKSSSRIWQDGATTIEFGRGVLQPQPVKELYTSPSKVLIDRAAKAMVWMRDIAG
ncbi:hypothetical protein B296_00002829 [Ensete ventricosum]|uniref:Uncharacterized protein n=1 Tax=Ensete ventricosum TaxID=4639 RepID=A0A427A4N7_ENSVE|nr:hypothetical protein B296_00002829 [Ensete ventricosum]